MNKKPHSFKPYWLLVLLAVPLLPSLEVRISNLEKAMAEFGQVLDKAEKSPLPKAEFGSPSMCGGRLTLTSGQPVPVTDPGSQSTIYFSPYKGGRIALFNGVSRWLFDSFTEKALALTGLSSGFNYDVFAYDNTGVVTLDTPVKWTDDTARATSLDILNGIYVKNGAHTRRYLGTFRATDATHTSDSIGTRWVWNQCNRVLRKMTTTVTTSNSYSGGPGPFDSNSAYKVSYVTGQAEYTLLVQALANGGASGCCCPNLGGAIGIDATNANSATLYGGLRFGNSNDQVPIPAYYYGSASTPIGYHSVNLLQNSNGDSARFFSGPYNTSNPTVIGLEAYIDD